MRNARRIILSLAGALIVASSIIPAAAAPQAAQHPLTSEIDSAGPIAAQRAWWKAFVVGDIANLQSRSLPAFSLTLSSGKTFDRAAMLAQAATHVEGHIVNIDWADETVRFPQPGIAIVSSRVTEDSGPIGIYRYLTVLQRVDDEWRVIAAQSTREIQFSRRVSAAAAGPLGDLEGSYLTPKGAILRIAVRDSQVTFIEPNGKQLLLEPVGPGMFEFGQLSLDKGLIRMVFTRDASGKVVSFSRLLTGEINTFTRIPSTADR